MYINRIIVATGQQHDCIHAHFVRSLKKCVMDVFFMEVIR